VCARERDGASSTRIRESLALHMRPAEPSRPRAATQRARINTRTRCTCTHQASRRTRPPCSPVLGRQCSGDACSSLPVLRLQRATHTKSSGTMRVPDSGVPDLCVPDLCNTDSTQTPAAPHFLAVCLLGASTLLRPRHRCLHLPSRVDAACCQATRNCQPWGCSARHARRGRAVLRGDRRQPDVIAKMTAQAAFAGDGPPLRPTLRPPTRHF